MKEAECPTCLMTALSPEGACPRCGGRWFKELPPKLREAVKSGPLRPRSGTRLCPTCGQAMVNGGLINEFFRADLCGPCQGLWLDKNELSLLEKL